ncbi:MAG: hypothetical protein QNK37_34795 [Acidobacteriota bacterium]|nr:hypothetical protein [Acidobacteriota bacterium]
MRKIESLLLLFHIAAMITAGEYHRFIKFFPDDSGEKESDFIIGIPKQLLHNSKFLYVLDQGEHGFHILNFDGSHVRTFGGEGDAPGDLTWPHHGSVTEEELVVMDQTGRVSFFDIRGNYRRRVPMLDVMSRFTHVPGGFFFTTRTQRAPFVYAWVNRDLEKIKTIEDQLYVTRGKSSWARNLFMKRAGDAIYFLQMYDTAFRVFDLNSDLIRKGRLNFDPLEEPEYQETGAKFTYRCFTVFRKHLIAAVISKGCLRLMVFQQDGKLIKKVRLPLQAAGIAVDELVNPMDLAILQRDGKQFLYSLLILPYGMVLMHEFDDRLFLSTGTTN